MSAWSFVTAAYTITLGGAVVLTLTSWWAMRRAEAAGRDRP